MSSSMNFVFRYSDPEPIVITVEDNIISTMSEGLGFNWFSGWKKGTYPGENEEARWEKIFNHLDWLNAGFFRFGQPSGLISDHEGNFKPGDSTFEQLKRLNQLCEKKDGTIILDPWNIPQKFCFEPWDGAPRRWNNPNSGYSLGVKDIDGYVNKFVVPYARYVIEEMDCKAVKWFNHVNEPLQGNILATPEGIDDHVRYVEVLAAIRQGMDEAGLSCIGNMGPDSYSHQYWPIEHMLEKGADPDPYIQAYCMHQYQSRFDWTPHNCNLTSDPMTETIENQLRKYCRHAHENNKPYLVTEIGMFYYGWSNGDPTGIARHDNMLLETEFIVRAMRESVDGMLRWSPINPGDFDGAWQLIETVNGSDEPVINPYYGYGTLMRFVNRNASILETNVVCPEELNNTVYAVSVINTDGTRTLLVVNDNYSECARITINLAGWETPVIRKFINDSARKYYECDSISTTGGVLEYNDTISPMSLTVYTSSLKE